MSAQAQDEVQVASELNVNISIALISVEIRAIEEGVWGCFLFVFCSADVLVLRRLGKTFCLGVVVVEVWGGCVEQEERAGFLLSAFYMFLSALCIASSHVHVHVLGVL